MTIRQPFIHREPRTEEERRLLHPNLTPAEELAAANPGAPPMPDDPKPAEAPVSPTGAAVLPPKAVPYVLTAISVLGVVGALPTMGISLIPAAICNGALALALVLGALAGVASPGLRKKE